MTRIFPILAAAMLSIGAAPPAAKAPSEIVAAAPAAAWRAIDAGDLLVMELASGARVAIQLAPAFAPVHVANIRALVRGGWFDGNAIVRVQDNYVVQWGGAAAAGRKPPAGIVHPAPAEYERSVAARQRGDRESRDAYASAVGFADGWPVASDGRQAWLPHCYGMVGIGRDMPPDTGDGSELYAVIGQAPRHLDRNIAVGGRVIEGMPALASLPRGTADLGFYADPAQHVAIRKAWIASDMPAATRPRYETMRTDTAAFAAYADARANRRDAFFIRPAGGADLCNVPVPIRRAG
jgi:peptidylprolyl isomerase